MKKFPPIDRSLYDNLPEEMKEKKQWILVKIKYDVEQSKKLKRDKWKKIPYHVSTKYKASSTNPDNWSSYDDCIAQLETLSNTLWTLGYVFHNDYIGIDIDNEINKGIVKAFKSYTEYSLTGTGIHIICRGVLPEGANRKGNYEMYSKGRYFVVTGNVFKKGSSPYIEERDTIIIKFWERFIRGEIREQAGKSKGKATCEFTPEDVIELIKKDEKATELFTGDTAGYSSRSEADAALCMKLAFYCQKDVNLIDRVYRKSQLYRSKWDSKRGNSTWGANLIRDCVKKQDKVFKVVQAKVIKKGALYWDTNKNGDYRPSFRNGINLFTSTSELQNLLRWNEFTFKIEFNKLAPFSPTPSVSDPLNDNNVIQIKEYIVFKHNVEFSVSLLREILVTISTRNSYHPIKNYLNSLKWDGEERIDTWLPKYTGCEDTKYTRSVGGMTLVAMCARIDKPGIQYDNMLILDGAQGIKKTTALRILGGEWYAEIDLLGNNKDFVTDIMGKWVIEVAEMAAFSKKDIDTLKAMVSRTSDRSTLKYEKFSCDFPRQCVLIGTINSITEDYLRDQTGNRRFFPVEVHTFDTNSLQIDKDQLFAEAYHKYKNGYKLYIDDEETLALAIKAQQKKELVDGWYEIVEEYVRGEVATGNNKFTSIDVYLNALKGSEDRFERKHQIRISVILKKLGFDHKPVRINGEIKRGYVLDKNDVPF